MRKRLTKAGYVDLTTTVPEAMPWGHQRIWVIR
jgi:hypothetical protein